MKGLTPDERAEWNQLLDDANAKGDTTSERGRAVVDMLDDAEQAQKTWVPYIRGKWLLSGATGEAKARLKVTSTTLVSLKTASSIRPMAVGTKTRTPSGAVADTQKLFIEMTWAEVEAHRDMLLRQLRELGFSAATDNKLLGLRDKYPATKGPAEACRKLGVTIEAFLGEAAVA